MRWIADLVITVVMLMLFAYCLSRAVGAPVPVYKDHTPSDVRGCYDLEWAGTRGGKVVLDKGIYYEEWFGSHYQGNYGYDRATGVLSVTCSRVPVGQDSPYGYMKFVWSVTFVKGVGQGKGTNVSKIVLRKRVPAQPELLHMPRMTED